MKKPPKKPIIVLGADHNGIALKRDVKMYLSARGYACIDIGPFEEGQKVDYVDYALTLGQIVHDSEADRGILICGTGVGMSMAANRFSNVRASLVHSLDVARKTREHNDANVLCLGAWVVSKEENLAIVDAWMDEKFGQGRHVPRVEKTKKAGAESIIFTNGIFDVLHPGHVRLLKFSKSLGGKLVVGINSDRATRELKGPDRPIFNQKQRKEMLEGLRYVDEVVIFDDTETHDLVADVKPDIVVKGGEWTAEQVRKRDRVPAYIKVKVFPLVFNPEKPKEKYSTTAVVKKIRGTIKAKKK